MASRSKNKNIPVPHSVLSDRGVHLEHSHKSQHGSNINSGQNAVIGENYCVKIGSKCPECGFRVRGLKHAEGAHHRKIVPKHKRKGR